MRPFYLSKNQCGYYRVTFVDPVTGWRSVAKSTHTKDQYQAMMIATTWLNEGKPEERINSRNFKNSAKTPVTNNLKSMVAGLSENELKQLAELLSKNNVSVPNTDSVAAKSVLETPSVTDPNTISVTTPIAVSASDSVSTPALEKTSETTLAATQKKRRIVVVKKLSEEKTVPAKTWETSDEKIPLCDFLDNFWDYDNSQFIERTLAYGHSMSRKHAFNQRSFVRNYWRPYWGDDTCIEDLTKPELDDFFFYLFQEVGLKGETVNKVINSCSRATRWLFDNKRIKENPMLGVERFKPDTLVRGIPTESEVRELLNLDWENQTAFLAFKIAAFCGLRAGEISGLRVCDLDVASDIIHVRHSFSETDGLKTTKNKDTRDLPIDHQTILQLMNHARTNPEYGDMSYVFYQPQNPSKAYYPGYYNDIFYLALDKIGIHEAERKDRNIVFHSLRHFCATLLAQRTDLKTVQTILGHRTIAMSAHYSDHETIEKFNNVRTIMSDAWEKLLSA